MALKMIEVDLQTFNLIQLIKRVGTGTIEIKVQNGRPVRVFKSTENIDLSNNEEIKKVK